MCKFKMPVIYFFYIKKNHAQANELSWESMKTASTIECICKLKVTQKKTSAQNWLSCVQLLTNLGKEH